MNRKMFAILLLMVVGAFGLKAQELEEWTWDTYKTAFMAPSDMEIEINNADRFSAGNQGIHLDIFPRKDENLSKHEMSDALEGWADDSGLSYDGGANFFDDLNGYWGCYIDATAKNGYPTSVLLLVDPDYPDITMYVWLQYWEEYYDTAVEILKSFTPN